MRCAICKQNISITFLGKISGTYIKKDGKLLSICSSCQARLKTKSAMLKSLPR